jgi:hypothetical protein
MSQNRRLQVVGNMHIRIVITHQETAVLVIEDNPDADLPAYRRVQGPPMLIEDVTDTAPAGMQLARAAPRSNMTRRDNIFTVNLLEVRDTIAAVTVFDACLDEFDALSKRHVATKASWEPNYELHVITGIGRKRNLVEAGLDRCGITWHRPYANGRENEGAVVVRPQRNVGFGC